KYHVRASIAAIMVQVMRERNDKEGEKMWNYVLNCLGKLEHDGMSDEEEGTEEIVTDGKVTRVQVRKVMQVTWRHPSFRGLFELVDKTRGVEAAIFSRQGRPPMTRIRVDEEPSRKRPPPKHLPVSFFKPEYLQDLSKYSYQIDELRMSKKEFPLYEVNNLQNPDE
ncbi:hypothetical protein K435DRAFT_655235, partial [Dendrothele bispora CBS 962.96]